VFAKKHATLLGLNLRSTMRVSAHVTHDLTQMLNSYVRLALLDSNPSHIHSTQRCVCMCLMSCCVCRVVV
jgi:hypothetical protein